MNIFQVLFTPHIKSKVDDLGLTYYCTNGFFCQTNTSMAVIVCKLEVVYLIK